MPKGADFSSRPFLLGSSGGLVEIHSATLRTPFRVGVLGEGVASLGEMQIPTE